MTQFTPGPFRDDSRLTGEDWKNIFLFIVLSVFMAYLFNAYVIKPRDAAMQAYQNQKNMAEAALSETITKPRPRDQVMAEGTRLTLENGEVDAKISTRGSRIDALSLRNYFTTVKKEHPIDLLSPSGTDYPHYAETGWVTQDAAQKMPDQTTIWQVIGTPTGHDVVFSYDNGTGLTFTRTVTLDEHFMFTVKESVTNNSGQKILLWPYALASRQGLPEKLDGGIVHEGAIGYVSDSYLTETYGAWAKLETAPVLSEASTGWIGITSRYFFLGLVPDQKETAVYRIAFRSKQTENDKDRYQVDVQGADRTVEPGQSTEFSVRVFAGAKKLRLLEQYESKLGLKHFDLAVDFGWFYFLTKPFYFALTYIYDFVGNFGLAIIVLTFLIRLAVFPLANTSFRSFAKMKKVAPQVQELQKTYIHDKKKMQEELVKLYERERVNPISGCLPILAQIPIFFAMYKVINVAIEMRHAPFFGWIQDLSAPDPTTLFNLYGLLPYHVPEFLHFGAWPAVMFCMVMLQVRLSPPPPDRMMYIFFNYYYPVIVCFIMAKFAAGLVIYWACSSFLSIAQQIIIMRSVGTPIHLFERFAGKKEQILAEIAPDVLDEPAETPSSLPDDIKVKKKKK